MMNTLIPTRNPDREPMNASCRVCIMIPAHAGERRLYQTLEQYAVQTDMDKNPIDPSLFEITVLVNAGERIANDARPLQDIARFKNDYPDFHVNIIVKKTSKGYTIGSLRKDIGRFSTQRIAEAGLDSGKIVLVTNDADSVKINPTYIHRLITRFDRDDELQMLAGKLDYPYEDYFRNHALLVVERFIQAFDIICRYKYGRDSFRGGNTAIRASAYMEVGGHGRARKRENFGVYMKIRGRYGHESVSYDPIAKIITNARRALFTLNDGKPLSAQYADFGFDKDVSYQKYFVGDESLDLPESHMQATNPRFQNVICDNLNAHLRKTWSFSKTDKERSDILYAFKKAGHFIGLDIEIDTSGQEPTVGILDIDTVRKLVLQKYNHI